MFLVRSHRQNAFVKPDIGKYQMYKLNLTYSSLLPNTFVKSADLLSSLFMGHPKNINPGPTELATSLQPLCD